jgi:hypothetical protein
LDELEPQDANLHADAEPDTLSGFRKQWYANQLSAMGEPILWDTAPPQHDHLYRFLWLRTFHNPVAVRLDIPPDGTPTVTLKVADGQGGYSPGKLSVTRTFSVSSQAASRLLSELEGDGFWRLPTHGGTLGLDGARWIIEGVRDGTYHIVDRWSPRGKARSLGVSFLDVAGFKVKEDELY